MGNIQNDIQTVYYVLKVYTYLSLQSADYIDGNWTQGIEERKQLKKFVSTYTRK